MAAGAAGFALSTAGPGKAIHRDPALFLVHIQNADMCRRVDIDAGRVRNESRDPIMLRTLKSTAFVSGLLFAAMIPATVLAEGRGHGSGGGHGSFSGRSSGGRSFSGGSRNFSGGRENFASPRGNYSRGYSARPVYPGRSYGTPRAYVRPGYRGYYGGGLYFGYSAPYPYGYDGYAYDPGYSYAPAPVPPPCNQGYYDGNGAWVPDPACYSGQQPSPPAQQNYSPNQQPYPPQQGYYDSNQAQQYQQPQYQQPQY
jgi:hypothetical protein